MSDTRVRKSARVHTRGHWVGGRPRKIKTIGCGWVARRQEMGGHEKAGKVWVGTSVSKMARKLWVCLVNEKERKVCLLGGRPWSGSNVQEGLASCMKRRARCVYGWRPWSGSAVQEGLASCMKRRARCVYGWKALEWECGGGWVGRVNKKARKVCVDRGPWSGSAV